MRSETEIRRDVETRLRRRGLLILNGGLWVAAVFVLSQIMPFSSFGTTFSGLLVIGMLSWTLVLGLHVLRTGYVELREWLVRRAIQREYQFYLLHDAYEKRKHDGATARLSSDISDGELIDFPGWRDDEKVKHER